VDDEEDRLLRGEGCDEGRRKLVCSCGKGA
jgi:hypothetical protein